jgi:hypothetical protein
LVDSDSTARSILGPPVVAIWRKSLRRNLRRVQLRLTITASGTVTGHQVDRPPDK